jgi:serine/threonine-protein kinase RsbW
MLEINLALDELFTNIISYGFRDDLEHLVKIQIMRENGTLTLCVEDNQINEISFVESEGGEK